MKNNMKLGLFWKYVDKDNPLCPIRGCHVIPFSLYFPCWLIRELNSLSFPPFGLSHVPLSLSSFLFFFFFPSCPSSFKHRNSHCRFTIVALLEYDTRQSPGKACTNNSLEFQPISMSGVAHARS